MLTNCSCVNDKNLHDDSLLREGEENVHIRYMTYHGMRHQLNFTPCYGDANDLGKKITEILWTGLGPLSF